MNRPDQLERFKTNLDLAASLSDYNDEINKQKAASQAEKKQVDDERLLKKAEKPAAEALKQSNLLLGMMVDLAKGADYVLTLSNQQMRNFIKYYFELSLPKLPQMKKDALQNILHPHLLGENDESLVGVHAKNKAETIDCNMMVTDILCGENVEDSI